MIDTMNLPSPFETLAKSALLRVTARR